MEKIETIYFSTDFDNAVNLRYRDQRITIPYEHLPFIQQELRQHIANVEMAKAVMEKNQDGTK